LSAGGAGLQPFDNIEANADYDNVVGAVESGNLAAAEVAFSSLQTALQITGHSGAGHVLNVTV
jgi:hypothetical protein